MNRERAGILALAVAITVGPANGDGGVEPALQQRVFEASTNLTLAWDPPLDETPLSYVVEAGSAPGLSDIAAFDTQSAATTALVPGVPPGTYFVRVRTRTFAGLSDPSNEITVRVGGQTGQDLTCLPPAPPTGVGFAVRGSVVSLRWKASSQATSYVIEAGLAPDASDVYVGDVGNLTSMQAAAAPGHYYVRVRARGACGISPPSTEIDLTVGGR